MRRLTTFAAALAALASPVVAQRAITNVATAEWYAGGARVSRSSNRVDIVREVEPVAVDRAVTFRFSSAGSANAAIASTRCGVGSASRSVAFGPAWSDVAIGTMGLVATSSYSVREPLVVVFAYAAGNRERAAVDQIEVTLRTAEGDAEALTLTETGPDTGRFAGAMPTVGGSAPVAGDCRVSVRAGATTRLSILAAGAAIAEADIRYLIDPFGIVFDSLTGEPVAGARVSLVDADTGRPADVFGDDGVSAYPSTVATGQSVTDAGGTRYDFPPGDYRFPLTRAGRYRLLVEPPAPYAAWSAVPPADLARLRTPDGAPFTIDGASYGGVFTLDSPAAVRIDVPVDAPAGVLTIAKSASVATAEVGDVVQYRITVRNRDARPSGAVLLSDRFPKGFRYRNGTLRSDGAALDTRVVGGTLSARIPAIPAGGTANVTYLLEILGSARAGDAINRAQVTNTNGVASAFADAVVRVSAETITARMTITGRITEGGCNVDPRAATGVGGIRVMLEDGSYAVTDREGRYHFEGVSPGVHVVQMDLATLPADRAPADCGSGTRGAGRAFSRFVEGGGGSHKRVDFRLAASAPRTANGAVAPARPVPASDAVAAGAEIDWLARATPGTEILFPSATYNPRAKVTRVAIKHALGVSVRLTVDGKPADPLTFEGTATSADGRVAVSRWRGIPLENTTTRLEAAVGTTTLTRTVHVSSSAMRAEIVPSASLLVADGVTRPVLAVRFTDRDGRPVRGGSVGEFTLPAPYLPAVEADAQAARKLSGLERAQPFWRVDGDDGLAYIALEPTTASGAVAIDFSFRDGDVRRDARVDAWLDAGARPWTIVGFAAGTFGFNALSRNLETLSERDSKTEVDGRIALYAKGRVRGRWLLTLAYDSGKREDDARFAGTIDPQGYYTIYADRSERRYDASSIRKLYVKLERPQFVALFGDFDSGFDEAELTRYARALNGLKAEYRGPRISATAFAADTPFAHGRDEIQGNGLTGPYALRARDVLANSEQVSIETRDRFRSNLVIATRRLTRHIDYDIDYAAGTLRFREPVLSRSSKLDPQIIVADYEVDGVAGRSVNAGGRVAYRDGGDTLRVGVSAVRDAGAIRNTGARGSTTLVGADVKYRPAASSEVPAEIAVSEAGGEAATAWLVEAEHHGARTDVLAYARSQDSGFGIGQTNRSEDGSRKFGIDGRMRLTDRSSLSASGWHETFFNRDARRIAGRGLVEYRGGLVDLRVGLILARDRLPDGRTNESTLVQLGASRRFGRLELDGSSGFALGGDDDSVDFPARHKVAARFAVSDAIGLVASYEIASGGSVDARTARVGFDLKPWAGARFAVTGNVQDIAEYGPRSFAAYGLSQSLALGRNWTVDVSLDGNRTIGGIDLADVVNPAFSAARGGFVGDGSLITEDFTALTAGATFRAKRWSATGRAEYRAGERGDRYGVTAAALRQIGEGSALGGAFNWNVAGIDGGPRTRTAGLAVSWAHRPTGSRLSWLEKLELRDDRVTGAIAGSPGPIGGAALLIDGDARSRRIVNSLSVNWSPMPRCRGAGRFS